MNMANDVGPESSADKCCFVSLKRWFPALTWYILGVATPFVMVVAVGAVLSLLDVKLPKSKVEIMVDKWRIRECNDTLLVDMPVEPNIYMTLGIKCEPDAGWLEEIGIIKGRDFTPEDMRAVFVYRTKGEYGIPMAYYGLADQGMMWRDLNFDSYFDQRVDYKNKLMEINIGDAWVAGEKITEVVVKTDRGGFYFDPNAGEWKPAL